VAKSDPEAYAASLAQSDHLRVLAGMMAQDGIPIASATGRTHSGHGFAVILVQGAWCESLTDLAERVARLIADENAKRAADSITN
jgi:hypothetical protein